MALNIIFEFKYFFCHYFSCNKISRTIQDFMTIYMIKYIYTLAQ